MISLSKEPVDFLFAFSILPNMQSASPKIIVICGPTASGKSDVAIRLAKKFNGEVISADSRQIYRGMSIGTGKVPGFLDVIPSEATTPQSVGVKSRDLERLQKITFISDNIPHHLIDIIDPMEDFNVSHFKKAATVAIKDILSRGKLPIICGGTGFWIDALVNNIEFPKVEPDQELRNILRNKSAEELFAMLSELDPERAKTIDKNNPVRLIRAIEITTALGAVPKPRTHSLEPSYSFLQIGIDVPREILNEKIKKRLDERFKQGMIAEVENLHKNKVSWEWMEKIGLEYRWVSRYLQGQIGTEEMREKLYFDIIHYAKRQITWLKKNKEIIWLSGYVDIEKATKNFLEN